MEPKLPTPELGPEQSQSSYEQNVGQSAELGVGPRQFEVGHDSHERQGEVIGGSVVTTTVLPPPLVIPSPDPAPLAAATNVSLASDTPTLAGDEDLIEKEWVDKAKKIILQTKDDPYRREQEVSRLQSEYLRKRYGRESGASQ